MGISKVSKGVENVNNYCKTVGIIFLVLGVIHIILSGVLSSWWGVMLILLGILVLSYRSKIMIIIVGSALILVGILNISDSILYEIDAFWLVFGVLQIIWGVQELIRYKHTKENPRYIIKKESKNHLVKYLLIIFFVLSIIVFLSEIIFVNNIASLNPTLAIILFCAELLIFITTFVLSIINLSRYNKKVLAAFSLILSLTFFLVYLSGFFYGLIMGGLADFDDEQIQNMVTYCDNLCIEKINDSYEYYQIDYDEIKEIPLCYCLDYNQEYLLDEEIPASVYN